MVKGLSRKVIIVKSPDPKIFEQAIFIVRDEYALKQGISQKELLRQAKNAADGYINDAYGGKAKGRKYIGIALGVCSALIVSIAALYFSF